MYFCTGFIVIKQTACLSSDLRDSITEVAQILDDQYSGAETKLNYDVKTGLLSLSVFAYLQVKEEFEEDLYYLRNTLLDMGLTDLFGVLYCYDSERFPDAMYVFPVNPMETRADGLFFHMDPFFSPLSQKLGPQRLF